MKEFNLSEKIKELRENCEGFSINSIMDLVEQQDKEFIQKLKEETYWVNGHSKLCDEIDKLAGSKLVEAKGE